MSQFFFLADFLMKFDKLIPITVSKIKGSNKFWGSKGLLLLISVNDDSFHHILRRSVFWMGQASDDSKMLFICFILTYLFP